MRNGKVLGNQKSDNNNYKNKKNKKNVGSHWGPFVVQKSSVSVPVIPCDHADNKKAVLSLR